MNKHSLSDWQHWDQQHIWHPYAAMPSPIANYPVVSAQGVTLQLSDGRQLVDGMASWWAAIHGYNHPQLNLAIQDQLKNMAHVMFGGLTHEPAATLAAKLVKLTPAPLQHVFFCDSGSVAVEVAIKQALQYWLSRQHPAKNRLLALRNGYHGDTFMAMSVCDPVNGMHHLFKHNLTTHYFTESPTCRFDDVWQTEAIADFKRMISQHHAELAAVILEPIVQGAGGMRFYHLEYLRQVRQLCDQYEVLLIADEIATGFGRTGRLFACEHADISPDILCLGKALTGGYLSFAATLCTTEISQTISQGDPGLFMHGPTFMANPLACAVAVSSIELLLNSPWQQRVAHIADHFQQHLAICQDYDHVADVRVLGAIAVIELKQAVNMAKLQPQFVNRGVWLRPFGKLVYVMPPYIIDDESLHLLSRVICEVVADPSCLF